jgi:hypothetical protein
MPKISPEEFAAIIEKHSKVAEYDVVTNLLQTIPENCDPELVDRMVAENQGVNSLSFSHLISRSFNKSLRRT